MEQFLGIDGVVVIALLSIAVGFLLDTLKLYQLTPGYTARKAKFLKAFADALNIPIEEASSYFSLATQVSRERGITELELRQSQWILADHTAKVFSISVPFWACIFIWHVLGRASLGQIVPAILVLLVSAGCAVRLIQVASQEREKSDRNYIMFAKENREAIIRGWKLKLESMEKAEGT